MKKQLKKTKKDIAELNKLANALHEQNMRMFGIIRKESPLP